MKEIIIEYELLLALYWGNQYSLAKIGNIFSCSNQCIRNKLIKHNIPVRNRIDSHKLLRGLRRSPLTEFKKGVTSWNKGTKGIMKLNSGSFKRDGRMSGENHWNWKGGITPKSISDRLSIDYHIWRNKILIRDNYTCKSCGVVGGHDLHCHHIKSFADYPKLRFDVNNGILLCKECHLEIHKSNGTGFMNLSVY